MLEADVPPERPYPILIFRNALRDSVGLRRYDNPQIAAIISQTSTKTEETHHALI